MTPCPSHSHSRRPKSGSRFLRPTGPRPVGFRGRNTSFYARGTATPMKSRTHSLSFSVVLLPGTCLQICSSFVELLTGGRGPVIHKDERGLRPVIVGQSLLRLIRCLALAQENGSSITKYFPKDRAQQFGVGLPWGCEFMTTAVASYLEVHDNYRGPAFTELRKSFPSLQPSASSYVKSLHASVFMRMALVLLY